MTGYTVAVKGRTATIRKVRGKVAIGNTESTGAKVWRRDGDARDYAIGRGAVDIRWC
jgi:hypothetical protein